MMTDSTLDLLRRGYLFTANARRDRRSPREADAHPRYAVTLRLLGRPATVVGGSEGVRLFYDSTVMQRTGAMPQAVARPLFGRGAVHGLDGSEHHHRKSLFVGVLMDEERLQQLFAIADGLLVEALDTWRHAGRGIVHDTTVDVYGTAVMRWAGIELTQRDAARRARQLAEIVDGFATPVAPYARAWARRVACDRWAARLVGETRSGRRLPPAGSVLAEVASHRDEQGRLLDQHTAGVELLNVLRPTVAVARFAAFGTLALFESPDWRRRLASEVHERGSAVGGPLATAFTHEVRRIYPFVPLLAARAMHDTSFEGCPVPAGQRVLLDVLATNHDPQEWESPRTFDPERFLGTGAEWSDHFVPQGGGRPETGHRCPGELVAVGLLALTFSRLAQLDASLVRGQDAGWSWRRIPTLPRSGVVVEL